MNKVQLRVKVDRNDSDLSSNFEFELTPDFGKNHRDLICHDLSISVEWLNCLKPEESPEPADNIASRAILPIALGCPCVGCQRGSVENCAECVAKQQANGEPLSTISL